MLEKLKLTNIQKHKALELTFSPGVNVIYGSTDSGKTSILRGLLWVILNRNTGQLLVNNEVQPRVCEVVLTIDGQEITRSWGASNNTYALNGHEFKSFRTSVPSEIATLVNIGSVSIQERRDLPFMVYYKASENAEQFSSMLNITEIQTTITNCNKKVKAVQDAVNAEQEKLIGVNTELTALAGLDDAEKEFHGIQGKVVVAEKQTSLLNATIRPLIDQFDKATATINTLAPSLEALKTLDALEDRVRVLHGLKAQANSVNEMVATVERTFGTVRKLKHAVVATESLKRLEGLVLAVDSVKERSNQVTALKASAQIAAQLLKTKPLLVEAKTEFERIKIAVDSVLPARKKDLWYLQELGPYFTACVEAAQEAAHLVQTTKQAWNAVKGSTCPTCGGIIGDCADGN